ncbi:hypothetical protein [Streptomyces sp. NPDC059262]|uniref:hypothetical protein n=1 Tax=Streptomyces sp. NPDC059262 TaxID=3346797 RepID=UPI003690E75C
MAVLVCEGRDLREEAGLLGPGIREFAVRRGEEELVLGEFVAEFVPLWRLLTSVE